MSRYDTNAAWSDPFEPKPENKRGAERFKFRLKVSIKVQDNGKAATDKPRILIGPGVSKNLSVSGAWLITKHQLVVNQRIIVAIPTNRFAVAEFLPAMFIGPAEVVRVKPDLDGRIWAAVHFGDAFTQNMEFAEFIQGLYALREALTKKN